MVQATTDVKVHDTRGSSHGTEDEVVSNSSLSYVIEKFTPPPHKPTVTRQKYLALTVFRAKPIFCVLIYKTVFNLKFPENFNKLRTLI